MSNEIEDAIQTRGRALWQGMHDAVPGLFDERHWQAKLLDWAMRDDDFKTALFRFVDVLPMLEDTRQVAEHVHEYLLKQERDLPRVIRAILRATERSITSGVAARLIRANTTQLARTFIAGADANHALPALERLHRDGYASTVDLLGEVTLSTSEASEYQGRYLALIETLAARVHAWPALDVVDANHLGPLPRANASLKLSALEPHLDVADLEGSVARLAERALPILLKAQEEHVFVNIDLEHWELHEITYTLFEELLSHPRLRGWPHAGIVVQAYLKSAQRDIERLQSLARTRGAPITVRLVKGAYWDQEVVRSRRHGFQSPVFLNKDETDAHYELLAGMVLERIDDLSPAFGSHNLRSLTHALVLAQHRGVPKNALEVQMLYGMAEPERQVLRDEGYRVRVYAPVGELLPGIAYLLRRLLENTSNQSFLRLGFHEHVEFTHLLAPPRPGGAEEATRTPAGDGPQTGDLRSPFENCSPTDFTHPAERTAFAARVSERAGRPPVRVPIVVGSERRESAQQLERECPSEPQRTVAHVSLATAADADEALRIADEAWPAWRDRTVGERAQLLENLAARLERDRHQLAALQIFEVGKPWAEADADVAEGIDFCRYYARRALRELAPRLQDRRPGESGVLRYQGRGPTAVIAPWNFPLAILCGMTTAALVAGNTVLMKPSGLSSGVAYALYERMLDVGFPPEVVQFLPGRGGDIGTHLVSHAAIAQIAFTGSKEVGLGIVERAARTTDAQRQVKRVVCEMGGKNAIVIDEDADLDAAVAGVVKSAFGYAGQKCSACSRCIAVGDRVYAAFKSRLADACRSLHIGPAHEPASQLGPVVDRASMTRLQGVIEDPGAGAKPIYVGAAPAGGYFVAPALFEVEDAHHDLMQRELFGPIVALMEVADFAQAMTVANSTQFALTGAVYSRHPANIDIARRVFRVGNLYINTPCTGALVQRQPFGGFAMSGLGTKAGGPGYLQQFSDPVCVTENTVRHGFAPDL